MNSGVCISSKRKWGEKSLSARASSRGVGGHQLPYRGASDDWLTPPDIIRDLGPFDLDPCASTNQPWPTAKLQLTRRGLNTPWRGFVWLNPPYGPQTFQWVHRLAEHNNGIALIFARTETRGFMREVWAKANALLFVAGRLHFHHAITGQRASFNSGAPSVLVAYGTLGVERLLRSEIDGALVTGWRMK